MLATLKTSLSNNQNALCCWLMRNDRISSLCGWRFLKSAESIYQLRIYYLIFWYCFKSDLFLRYSKTLSDSIIRTGICVIMVLLDVVECWLRKISSVCYVIENKSREIIRGFLSEMNQFLCFFLVYLNIFYRFWRIKRMCYNVFCLSKCSIYYMSCYR